LKSSDGSTDWVCGEFLINNDKADMVRAIEDPETLVDKQSVERKLLASLTYDFAKVSSVNRGTLDG
jgi:pyrimidine deaminase RibD-like protein